MSKQITFKAFIPNIQSALKFGANVGRVTLEIPETELQQAVPLIALQNCALRITVELDESVQTTKSVKAKKEPELKGEWGQYWKEMYLAGVRNIQSLWEVLEVEDSTLVWDKLHEVFEVESMAFVSPAEFEAWADKNCLQPLITLSRQAKMKAAA